MLVRIPSFIICFHCGFDNKDLDPSPNVSEVIFYSTLFVKQSFLDLEALITPHRFLEGWGEEVRIAQLHTLNEAVLRYYGLFSEMPTM